MHSFNRLLILIYTLRIVCYCYYASPLSTSNSKLHIDDSLFKLYNSIADSSRSVGTMENVEAGVEWMAVGKRFRKNSKTADANASSSAASTLMHDIDSLRQVCASESQLIVILLGIPGSGKSTFSNRILSNTSSKREWVVGNQDKMGSRKYVETFVKIQLSKGKSVIIDRCNVDQKQRSHWISIGNKHNVRSVCIILPNYNDVSLCSNRAFSRNDLDHPPGEDWGKICGLQANQLRLPRLGEGLAVIVECDEYKLNQVHDILITM